MLKLLLEHVMKMYKECADKVTYSPLSAQGGG